MNLFPLIKNKLYQSGIVGEIQALIRIKPTVLIDCTNDPVVLGNFSDFFIKIPFDDETLPIGYKGMHLISRLEYIGEFGAKLLRDGEVILTHCNAGENRSSLVDGMILLEYRRMGLITFKSVVDFIQNLRPGALTNKSFVTFLNSRE